MILHSAEEKGSLLAHAGEGQGFYQEIQVRTTVRKELKLKYLLYIKEDGIIYLLMACIIGKMNGVKTSDCENKHLKSFFINHQ